MLSYLYGLIPKPITSRGKSAWGNYIDHVVGLICFSADHDTMCAISNLEYPCTPWTQLWQMHGDPHISPFLEDPTTDCLLPLAH